MTSSDGALLLWLSKDRRHIDNSIIQITASPLLVRHLILDFSNLVHGDKWLSVAGPELHETAWSSDMRSVQLLKVAHACDKRIIRVYLLISWQLHKCWVLERV